MRAKHELDYFGKDTHNSGTWGFLLNMHFLTYALIFCSISINGFSDGTINRLNNELNIIKERIACVDQKITGNLITDKEAIISKAKEIILKELGKENEKVKSLIKYENRTAFFNVTPEKSVDEIYSSINKQYEDNWKLQEEDCKAKIIEEFPLLEPGIYTTIKTKRGVIKGYLRGIYPSCIKIDNKTIYFIDLTDDEIARLDKTRYQSFIEKELLKVKNKHENDKEQSIWKNILEEGYLPLSEVDFKFAFTGSIDVRWCKRLETVSLFMKKAEYEILTKYKNDYCLKNYGIGYIEMKKKVNYLNNQITQIKVERQRQEELEQSYRSASGSGRICADCGGKGTVNVWIRNVGYVSRRCRSCSGSGKAHYASDYLQDGRRVRSQMDQDLGRMMGTGGGGMGIFGN